MPVGKANERDMLGDDEDVSEVDRVYAHHVAECAISLLRGLAKHGDFDQFGDEAALRKSMNNAYHWAKSLFGIDIEESLGRRIGACAAVMLIVDNPTIFNKQAFPARRWPETEGAIVGDNYIVDAAACLAEDATGLFTHSDLPDHVEARAALANILTQFFADNSKHFTPLMAVKLVALTLAGYTEQEKLEQAVLAMPPKRPPSPGTEATSGGQPPPPPVLPHPKRPSLARRSWRLVRGPGVAVLLTIVVFGLVAWQVPAIPRFFLRGSVATIPVISIPPAEMTMSTELPNTDVQLFLMSGSTALSATDRTVVGRHPDVTGPVVQVGKTITFDLLISVHNNAPSLPKDHIELALQPTSPTDITDAYAMEDRDHRGPPVDELTKNKPIDIDFVADPTPRLYQFVLTAAKDDLNVGYWCGYNAKPLQIRVSATGSLKTSAVTSYPVYVAHKPPEC